MWRKENHIENNKIENAKEKAKPVKTEQSVKTNFFEALPWLKSKIARTIKFSYTYKDHAQNVSDHFEFFLGVTDKMVTKKSVPVQKSKSGTNFHYNFTWHNKCNKIKIQRSCYRIKKNSLTQEKQRKITGIKDMGYLPRVLFFNAF